jgi:hypothetical protein
MKKEFERLCWEYMSYRRRIVEDYVVSTNTELRVL